jgi:hypothetical protein
VASHPVIIVTFPRQHLFPVGRTIMNRLLAAAVLICAFAMPAHGQYFSLWADEGQTTSEFWTTTAYQAFTVYVFLDSGPEGAFGAEYKMTGPPGHFSTGSSTAPFISAAIMGTPYGAPGVSTGFTSCQNGTVWLFAVNCMASSLDPGMYTIAANDISSFCGIATCAEPDRPLAEAQAYNRFCYNTSDDSVENCTWGAIKKQF